MAGEEWYYAKGGQRLGPVPAAQLKALYERGEINDADYVWTNGMANWVPAGQARDQFLSALPANDPLAAMGIPRMDIGLDMPTSHAPRVAYGGGGGGEYAGFWLRFVAAIIDGIVLAIVQIPLSFVFGAFMATTPTVVDPNLPPEQQMEALGSILGASAITNGISFVITLAYYSLMEASRYQGTLGKLALGLRVTDTDGDPLSFGRALGRNLAKILSYVICFIGYIMAGFTERKQALHDMIAGTLVVRK